MNIKQKIIDNIGKDIILDYTDKNGYHCSILCNLMGAGKDFHTIDVWHCDKLISVNTGRIKDIRRFRKNLKNQK